MVSTETAVLVLTTAPSAEVAEHLARALLGAQLIACANIFPAVRSLYVWKGEVHDESEHAMILKTTSALAAAVGEMILRLHPYETPEFLVVPASAGSIDYLAWIDKACSGSPKSA